MDSTVVNSYPVWLYQPIFDTVKSRHTVPLKLSRCSRLISFAGRLLVCVRTSYLLESVYVHTSGPSVRQLVVCVIRYGTFVLLVHIQYVPMEPSVLYLVSACICLCMRSVYLDIRLFYTWCLLLLPSVLNMSLPTELLEPSVLHLICLILPRSPYLLSIFIYLLSLIFYLMFCSALCPPHWCSHPPPLPPSTSPHQCCPNPRQVSPISPRIPCSTFHTDVPIRWTNHLWQTPCSTSSLLKQISGSTSHPWQICTFLFITLWYTYYSVYILHILYFKACILPL